MLGREFVGSSKDDLIGTTESHWSMVQSGAWNHASGDSMVEGFRSEKYSLTLLLCDPGVLHHKYPDRIGAHDRSLSNQLISLRNSICCTGRFTNWRFSRKLSCRSSES